MATKRGQRRGRKRKQPGSFDEGVEAYDEDIPRAKKRKLSKSKTEIVENKAPKIRRSKRIKLHKSQTQSPQKPNKKAPNPFSNTSIPTSNPFNTSPRRRHSDIRRQYTDDQSSSDDEESSAESENENEGFAEGQTQRYKSPTSQMYNHNIVKSQPSTPNRSNYSRPRIEPKSKSAKKSRFRPNAYYQQPQRRSIAFCLSPNTKSISPPPSILPNLGSSQESESFSPPKSSTSPYKKRLKLERNDCISIPVQSFPKMDTVQNEKEDKNDGIWIKLFDESGEMWKFLLFLLFGFFIGFSVCLSVIAGDKIINCSNENTKAMTTRHISSSDIERICSCDIRNNGSTALCQPCIDENILLENERNECNVQKNELFEENVQIKKELNAKTNKDDIFMRNELERCQMKTQKLEQMNERCVGNECGKKYKKMEHDLGECNVEWAACEQLNRQMNKMNEKRLEEIERQRNKFKMCNEKLKKYKEKIKE